MNQRHQDILLEVGALPTAPFVEGVVNSYIRRFVAARSRLGLKVDRWGNLLVSYRGGKSGRGSRGGTGSLWLAAHTDHPGFIAERMTGKGRLRARWFGGVGLEFFKDADVRFYVTAPGSGGRPGQPAGQSASHCRVERIVPGRITSVVAATFNGEARKNLRRRPEFVYVEVPEPVPPGTIGMWYLPDPHVVGTQLLARGHDDLAQVAALLCVLDELDRAGLPGRVTCAFTRAEEVGFVGAIGLARDRTLPAGATFISLECSDAWAGGVNPGDGPILRVGDLLTTFDQETLSWMGQVARDLAGRDKQFKFQRKLMPGGSCESTPLAIHGYRTGAMCLPLLNYHNMGKGRGAGGGSDRGRRVLPEIIDLRDFANEVAWLVALVAQSARRPNANRDLVRRLDKRFAAHRPFLRKWYK